MRKSRQSVLEFHQPVPVDRAKMAKLRNARTVGSWLLTQRAASSFQPENNEVAKAVLNNVVSGASNLNCVIYDKMCVCHKAFISDRSFAKVKYWCVDRFHAKAHGDHCPCSPLLHRRLHLRLRDVNTSIAYRHSRGSVDMPPVSTPRMPTRTSSTSCFM